MTAKITISPEELAAGGYTPESLDQALSRYHQAGYLELENAFDPHFIRELQQAYQANYGQLREEEVEPVSLKVGEGRYMISVAIKPPFFDARLYANPFLIRLLASLLGPGFLINSLTCVTAYPGSKDQKVHADYPPLFHAPELSPTLEPYAITVAIPLIDLNEQTGTTAMLPGSHKTLAGTAPEKLDLPYVRAGSCYLIDYRLLHFGTENVSDRLRPILYVVYSRPWFIDAANFGKQPPVRIHPTDMAKIPPQYFGLFKRVIETTSNAFSLV